MSRPGCVPNRNAGERRVSNYRTRLIPDLFGGGLLAATIGLLFWNRATFDIWIARHDNLTAYLPWWSYLGERLSAGQIPGWNPHQFSGIPFLADPQSGLDASAGDARLYPLRSADRDEGEAADRAAGRRVQHLRAGPPLWLQPDRRLLTARRSSSSAPSRSSHPTAARSGSTSRPGSRSPCSARRSPSAPGGGPVAWPGSGSAPSPTARCWPGGSGRGRTTPP